MLAEMYSTKQAVGAAFGVWHWLCLATCGESAIFVRRLSRVAWDSVVLKSPCACLENASLATHAWFVGEGMCGRGERISSQCRGTDISSVADIPIGGPSEAA